MAFALQGEGRGHMTQALALAGLLRDAGHTLSHVHVGLGPGWEIPDYFRERIGAPIRTFAAPTHVLDDGRARVDPGRTTRAALRRLPLFLREARRRNAEVTPRTADVQVGFYDAVGGLARLLGSRVPAVVIGHHYLLQHPRGPRLPISVVAGIGLRTLTRITALRARHRLALSFDDPTTTPVDGLRVVPPLLRPELFDLEPRDEGFLLCYAVTPGVADRIVEWHSRNPGVRVEIFIAGGASALRTAPADGCIAHELDGSLFLDRMARCRAFAGSAGFESLCEAFWLGKPILAVPTPGQIEQTMNATDAERARVARQGSWEDLEDFWATATPPDRARLDRYRTWVRSGPGRVIEAIEAAAGEAA